MQVDVLKDKYKQCAADRTASQPLLISLNIPLVCCFMQVDLLKDQYEEVRGKLDCFQLLAEELSAGFTANQVNFSSIKNPTFTCSWFSVMKLSTAGFTRRPVWAHCCLFLVCLLSCWGSTCSCWLRAERRLHRQPGAQLMACIECCCNSCCCRLATTAAASVR